MLVYLLVLVFHCRNVVSFSDGLPDGGSGVPYFYLTTLDPTARYALKDQRSSLTISEYPIGTCGKADPENPTCAKLTLTGKVNDLLFNAIHILHNRFSLEITLFDIKSWKDLHFSVTSFDI